MTFQVPPWSRKRVDQSNRVQTVTVTCCVTALWRCVAKVNEYSHIRWAQDSHISFSFLSCPQQGLYLAFTEQCHSVSLVLCPRSTWQTSLVSQMCHPAASCLWLLRSWTGTEAVVLGCLAAQHYCPFLPSTTLACVGCLRNLAMYVTCSEFSRNGVVTIVINKLVWPPKRNI